MGAGYEFIWRNSIGEREPFYAWFLKRDSAGRRTHHIHMVKPDEASEERILFRNRLREHPEEAAEYGSIKRNWRFITATTVQLTRGASRRSSPRSRQGRGSARVNSRRMREASAATQK
ncbi:MAG: GrpB family protein [Flavobacteriales bacterium]|nr:GrpB family protein [Flavobacteriales bacterium]